MNPEMEHDQNTGSSPADEPVFVVIGKFRKPHGIQGEIRMSVLTESPELLSPGKKIYVGPRYQGYTIKALRWHGGDLLVSLEELPDRTAVEIFRNVIVSVKGDDIPELPEGEYYLHQLVGMEVVTDEDEVLGILQEVLITGANDVYLVKTPAGKELLLPAIDDVVREINIEKGLVRVHLIAGLLD
jgi:16S rRNA processing protein RimM